MADSTDVLSKSLKNEMAIAIQSKKISSKPNQMIYLLCAAYVTINFVGFLLYWYESNSDHEDFSNVLSLICTILPIMICPFIWLWLNVIGQELQIKLRWSILKCLSLVILSCMITITIFGPVSIKGNGWLANKLFDYPALFYMSSSVWEEIIFITFCVITFVIYMTCLSNDMQPQHLFYFASLCIGYKASFAIYENFRYVAWCEWQSTEWSNHALSCSRIISSDSIPWLGWMRSIVTIPMHCITAIIISTYIIAIYLQPRCFGHWVKLVSFPILVHLFHNIMFICNAQTVLEFDKLTKTGAITLIFSLLFVSFVLWIVMHRTIKVFVRCFSC